MAKHRMKTEGDQTAPGFQAWLFGVSISVTRIIIALILIKLTEHIIPNGPFGGGISLPDRFAHWDSGWLINIASHGYSTAQASPFYPGMPLLMRVISKITFGFLSPQSVGIALAWASFIGSSVILFHIVERRFGRGAAIFSTAMLAFWSGSVFFISAYAESLVIFFTLLSALFVQNKRYLLASVVAGVASFVAPIGAIFGIGIVVVAFIQDRKATRAIFYLLISEVGSIVFAVFLWIRFDNPIENLAAQKLWYRHVVFPFSYLLRNVLLVATRPVKLALGPLPPGNGNLITTWAIDDISGLIALAVFIGVIVFAIINRDRLGIPIDWLVFFVLGMLLINSSAISFGSTPSSEAVARLVGSLFPLYPFTYLLLKRAKFLLVPLLGVIATLALVGQLLFALNYWFT